MAVKTPIQPVAPAEATHPGSTNLLDYPVFRMVLQSRLYPAVLQYATVAIFSLIVYQLLAGPSAAHNNFGTAMVWVLWWPIIPLLFVLFGRFWCAICPFATLSDLVQKAVGLSQPVPRFLRRYGIWIIDGIFILITWADHTLGIVESPRGSGVLLLLIILGVTAAGAFFERRTWCRYLCFLGGLSGNYSRAGALELRATPEICARCTTQACYRGSDKAPGCPLFEFPRTMDTSANCNLCGYCVKSCPNDSIRISLREPTRELWFIRRPKIEESFLACVIMGIVFIQNITMLDFWRDVLAWLERATGTTNYFVTFTIAFGGVMLLPVGALFLASLISQSSSQKGAVVTFTIFGYALIPLDLATHLAHNLFHLLAEGKGVLFTAMEMFGVAAHGSPSILDNATIQVLQYLLVAMGIAGSLYTAYRIAESNSVKESSIWKALLPIVALVILLGVVNLELFSLPMAMRM